METRQSIINAIIHEEGNNSTSVGTSSGNTLNTEDKEPDHNDDCTDYNNNDNKSLEVHIWKESEEKLLITLRGDRESLFNSSRNHDKLWEDIRQEMIRQNINVTKLQCVNKWKNLRKKYKEVIDNSSKSGSAPITWKHVEAFNDLYGHKCSPRPGVVVDTSNKETLITLPDDELSSEKSDSPSSSCYLPQPGPSRPKKRKVKESDKEKLMQHIQKFDARQQQALEQFEQHQQKMEKMEKMEKMDRLLNIFEML